MIPPFLTDIPEYNKSMFDCVSLKNEIAVKLDAIEILDYMITVYPRNETINSFNFVYGRVDFTPVTFGKNQSSVIHFATEMFSQSEPLGNFESVVLNQTFKRLTKEKPTLLGRK
ncbi:MAG: hypothetical protein IPM47_00085 [Sphingobacteriales bacterium]|nr:MAG: hypothetical protein IPM47_00085 [Sphingobacteriales bacterium]